jgi:hypothetical protein
MVPVVRTITGRTNCWAIASEKKGASGSKTTGNQPNWTPNTRRRMMPNQKFGIAKPKNAKNVAA